MPAGSTARSLGGLRQVAFPLHAAHVSAGWDREQNPPYGVAVKTNGGSSVKGSARVPGRHMCPVLGGIWRLCPFRVGGDLGRGFREECDLGSGAFLGFIERPVSCRLQTRSPSWAFSMPPVERTQAS